MKERLTFRQVQEAGKVLGVCVERSGRRQDEYEAWREGDSSMTAVCSTVQELWLEVWELAPQEKRERYGNQVHHQLRGR